MTFIILACISGIVLAVAPFWASRVLRSRWKMPRGLFFKAGLAMLVIEVIHLAAIGNATSAWPQIMEWPVYLRALVFGVTTGLFVELGRFLVLDKMMKGVRSLKEGIYFGLGWNGLETAMLGIAIVIGIFGAQTLVSTNDLATSFPEASKSDIEQLKTFQNQAAELMRTNAVVGLAPILERGSMMVIDISLTLLILLALARGMTSYIWAAVAFRALFSGVLVLAGDLNGIATEIVPLAFGIMAFLLAWKIRKSLRPE